MKKFVFGLVISLCVQSAVASTNLSVALNTADNSPSAINSLDYGSYYFGRVLVNSRSVASFTVTNTGDEPLEFDRAVVWGMFFSAYHNCNRILQPKERCRFDIDYWPAFAGYHSGEFQLDFKQDSVNVRVWGDAVDRY